MIDRYDLSGSAEFILVHPFREGNGRIARLPANVMALQANKPELDFTPWDRNRDDYFLAIQAAMDCNYEPMKGFVRQALLHGDQDNLPLTDEQRIELDRRMDL